MTQENQKHPLQTVTELRLLAAALELQHLTGMAANLVPIPGGPRVIAIGTAAEVARLLEIAPVPATNASIDLAQLDKLLNVGAQMANVMFNLAQRPGDMLTGDHVATMDSLRQKWDAARRSLTSGAPAEPIGEVVSAGAPGCVLVRLCANDLANGTKVHAGPVHDAAAPSADWTEDDRREQDYFDRWPEAGAAAKSEQAPTLYARRCDIDGTMPGNRVLMYKKPAEEWCVPFIPATAAGAGSAQPRAEGDERALSRLDYSPTPEFSAWWTKNYPKLRNHSIFTKGTLIWNAARAALDQGAQAATTASASELVAAADAVVERWHSRDWKAPHTAEFIGRLSAAVGAAKRAAIASAPLAAQGAADEHDHSEGGHAD